ALALALLVITPELQGTVVVACVCGAWFARRDEGFRARLIAGCAGGVAAAVVAHALQHDFPSALKPLFLPGFPAPEQLRTLMGPFDDVVISGHSFPSERGTLFAALAIAALIASPGLGAVALAVTLLVDLTRVLLGLHYVADIVGGVGLAG